MLALLVLVLAPMTACKKKATATTDPAPPPFKVTDATTGFLFTWVDTKGDFHVEQSAKDVPLEGRDVVRVVDPSREEGTHGDHIFVADLRLAAPDGTYPVKGATLAEFDQVALARRQGKQPTLADDGGTTTVPTAVATNDTPPDPNSGGSGTDPVNTGHPSVIIYGASWCGPCHQAQAYLRKKNVPFVYNDIEKDGAAAKEMQSKLQHAGMHGGSIPVIDVHGKIMVGFNAEEIDQALGTAL